MIKLAGSKWHLVYLNVTKNILVNNSITTVSPNLLTNHFRDYRMATSFNFFKTKKLINVTNTQNTSV